MKRSLLLVSLVFVTACSGSTTSPTPGTATEAPGSSEVPSTALAQLSEPTNIHASVVSGTSVRVAWTSPEEGASFFRLFDDDSRLDGRISGDQRDTRLDTSYGTHCFGVQAIATDHTLDSDRSTCTKVRITPSIVGSWEQVSAEPYGGLSYTGSGRILVVHSDGKYYTKGTSPMKHGWWTSEGDNHYVFRICWDADNCEHEEGRLILFSDKLIITGCCAGPTITYQRTS